MIKINQVADIILSLVIISLAYTKPELSRKALKGKECNGRIITYA